MSIGPCKLFLESAELARGPSMLGELVDCNLENQEWDAKYKRVISPD